MTPERYYGQATTAFAEGRPEEVIDLLSRALDVNEDFQDARVVRGRAFAALREFKRAEMDFREVEYRLEHARPMSPHRSGLSSRESGTRSPSPAASST
jgi:hypothetical protein